MKICFVCGDINKTGGTERVCLLIANELAKKHSVTILSFKNGLNPLFKCNNKIKLKSLNLNEYSGFIRRKVEPYIKLKRFLKNNPQDIIITVDVILCLYTIPMKLFFKTKIIAWEHFNFRTNNGVKNRDRARRLSAKYADYIVVLTKTDLIEYQNNCNLKCPIINIYNPIVGCIKKSRMEKIVLAVGRFSYAKNFQELIDIWEKIENNNQDWKLVICGDGEEYNKLNKMVKDRKLKNIVLPGFCKNVSKYYSKASIYAMTSRYEGFPMVLLEAQQYSIPLISYDCFTGPSEIIENGKNGYLIKYGDIEEFIAKLSDLMCDNDKLQLFSKNSSSMVKSYDIENIITQWHKILEILKNKE